ncbi:MAG TPA: carboxypeptidase regulatory-like domain-containing protein [Bryobacteraceae bacterium]
MRILLVGLIGALTSVSLYAQAQASSQIEGVVTDATGAAVPGAAVKATHIETGAVRTAVTETDGAYVLANLPVGSYRLEVNKPGFSAYVQTGIVLQVATNPTIDIALRVGNVSEQVQVEANAALVETQATGVGTVVENQRILELPLNGRVATDLMAYTPAVIPQGVAGNGGFPGTQQYVIAGGQAFGVAFYLDGSVFNNPWDLANIPFPMPDTLQEFNVETSTLTAANGIHAGGTVTGVTKSGSNDFHGDLFEFFRNGDMNARNFFAPTRDTLKRNQFGGTVGGPVKRNKLFFFLGLQDTLIRQDPVGNTAATFVPTAAMEAGNWSACPQDLTSLPANVKSLFTNNQISPSMYDPAAMKLASLLPSSNFPCGNTSFGLVTQVNQWEITGRGDFQINDRHSLFGRYYRTHYFRPPSMQFTPDNLLTSSQGALNDADQSWAFGDTYLVGTNIVNQVRATVDRMGIHRYDNNYVSVCDLGAALVYCGYTPHQSGFAVTGGFGVGPGTGGQATAHTTPIQLNDDVSWVKGAHQINFGIGGEVSKMLFDGNVYAQTNWTFSSLPQFLLGQFSTNSLSLPNTLDLEKWFVNAYVQDTWKVSPRFTINAGVRWEPYLPPDEVKKYVYNFSLSNLINDIKTTQYVNAPPGLLYPGDPGFPGKSGVYSQWDLWAPRVAMSWDPKGDGKTVIRSSFGIAYDFVSGEMLVNSTDAPPFGGTEMWAGQLSNPYATNPGGNIFPYSVNANAPFATSGTYIYLPRNLKATSVNMWNLVVQRQFGKDWLATAQYLGSESEHLWDSYQANPAVYIPGNCVAGQYGLTAPGPCSPAGDTNAQSRRLFTIAGYPGAAKYYGYVESLDSGATASYNGLSLALTKRLSKGFLARANYTWSHCIGDLSTGDATGNAGAGLAIPNNRNYDRSNCQSNEIGGTFSSDRRQLFNLTLVYGVPKFGNAWATRLFSDWKVSGIWRYTSAYWVTASVSSDVALNEDSAGNQRPVQVLQNPLVAHPGAPCATAPCEQWINPAAFATPALGTLSGTGRDNIPGPSFFNMNGALFRDFSIHERLSFEFRAEAFNLTNHLQPGISLPSLAAGASGLGTTFGTSTFGEITSAQDPRILQLALKLMF